jgi:hypothetical protein
VKQDARDIEETFRQLQLDSEVRKDRDACRSRVAETAVAKSGWLRRLAGSQAGLVLNDLLP